jgi:DNA-3-methyladenine glycosylase
MLIARSNHFTIFIFHFSLIHFKLMKLPLSYYLHDDVVEISRNLIGKKLVTNFNGKLTSGIITETEAYAGETDRASHAFGGRRTTRTETMYAKGGVSYVYLCYGIHHLFNIVTNQKDIPHAVLIRGILPLEGIEIIQKRRNSELPLQKIASGPGTMSKSLGISIKNNGISLVKNEIWVENTDFKPFQIKSGVRIGVDYAGKDALLPYRFFVPEPLKMKNLNAIIE